MSTKPVVEVLGLHVVGDEALVRVAALLRRHHAGEREVRQPRGVALELVDLDQVRVVGDTEDQVDRVLATAVLLDLVQHRQERRKARAAGQEQHRPLDLAQVEAAQRAVERDLVAGLGPVPQVGGQHAVGGVPDQERDLVRARPGAERERPGLVGAGHLDVHVLAGQEPQRRPVVQLDRERERGVGQPVDRGELARVGRDARLGDVRRGRDPDDAGPTSASSGRSGRSPPPPRPRSSPRRM